MYIYRKGGEKERETRKTRDPLYGILNTSAPWLH
jgi:hypothetical protein